MVHSSNNEPFLAFKKISLFIFWETFIKTCFMFITINLCLTPTTNTLYIFQFGKVKILPKLDVPGLPLKD